GAEPLDDPVVGGAVPARHEPAGDVTERPLGTGELSPESIDPHGREGAAPGFRACVRSAKASATGAAGQGLREPGAKAGEPTRSRGAWSSLRGRGGRGRRGR